MIVGNVIMRYQDDKVRSMRFISSLRLGGPFIGLDDCHKRGAVGAQGASGGGAGCAGARRPAIQALAAACCPFQSTMPSWPLKLLCCSASCGPEVMPLPLPRILKQPVDDLLQCKACKQDSDLVSKTACIGCNGC